MIRCCCPKISLIALLPIWLFAFALAPASARSEITRLSVPYPETGRSASGNGNSSSLPPAALSLQATALNNSATPEKAARWEIGLIPGLHQKAPAGPYLSRSNGTSADGLLQSGKYRSGSYFLNAELGEIRIPGSPIFFRNIPREGGSLAVTSGNEQNSVRLSTFAASNQNLEGRGFASGRTRSEGLLAGATGELSLFADRARFVSSFMTGSETTEQPGKGMIAQGREGNASRFSTCLDPFEGRLVTDAEVIFSSLDGNLADTYGAAHRTTYKLRIGGKAELAGIPLELEYRKLVSTGSPGPSGGAAKSPEADTFSGGLRYRIGPLDLGFKTVYFQQSDRVSNNNEMSAASFTLSPQLVFGEFVITSSMTVKRQYSYPVKLHTDTVGIDLGTKGCLLERMLDYELKGSFVQLDSGSISTRHSLISNVKFPAPFLDFLPVLKSPSLNIRGEYSKVNRKKTVLGEDNFTLFFRLDCV